MHFIKIHSFDMFRELFSENHTVYVPVRNPKPHGKEREIHGGGRVIAIFPTPLSITFFRETLHPLLMTDGPNWAQGSG